MNKKMIIDTRVEEAMQSLEGMQSATPGPFFVTRVMARLQRSEKNIWEKASAFIARPVIAVAVICLIVLMNGIVVFQQKELLSKEISSFTEQTDQNMYDEDLTLVSNTFYDYEITEP